MYHNNTRLSFLSTLSLRRATRQLGGGRQVCHNFYPRSPCGERQCCKFSRNNRKIFLSTLSLRRATPLAGSIMWFVVHFYPRSPCGERLEIRKMMTLISLIFLSTLSLRRATSMVASSGTVSLFLSTLSLRRATHSRGLNKAEVINFYPRSPCGERLWTLRTVSVRKTFLSTLSLRRATSRGVSRQTAQKFLSTLSLRRATWYACSIAHTAKNFYPRSPCGERRHFINAVVSYSIFLSTLSLRRATMTDGSICFDSSISIHALLAESDSTSFIQPKDTPNFYPRSPCGERH